MEGWFEFALERYNYWIVIILMMTGLYTVFSRGNLVKKIVGLNVFQTSVFIFYITIGKISGGTAPIFLGDSYKPHGKGYGEDGHGKDGYGKDGHGADADSASGVEERAVDNLAPDGIQGPDGVAPDSIHSKVENFSDSLKPNDLGAAAEALGPAEEAVDAPSLHSAPDMHSTSGDLDKIANAPIAKIDNTQAGNAPANDYQLEIGDGHGAGDAISGVGEVLYTNPLPHVLILTAIVVGVATTAVGLALAVRIREAYGTIEEDELEAIDNVAEFGRTSQAGGAA